MTNEHRFILEKGSKKHHCPNCNKRRFVRYIDTDTGSYLPEQYGRCDRESTCAYHLNPYLDGYFKAIREREQGNRSEFPNKRNPHRKVLKPQPTTKPAFIPIEVLKLTLQPDRCEENTFLQNLLTKVAFPFEAKDIEKVISLYYLGTVSKGYIAGAITFPFIDSKGNIKAIQVKQFNEANHTTGTDFLHSIIEKHHTKNNMPLPAWLAGYLRNDLKVSCLFGEHLLSRYPLSPVALVEAAKTAIYGTLYFGFPVLPKNLIWLAVYNKSSFSFEKLKALQGRDVYTFPDLSKDGATFDEWQQKAKEFESRLPGTRFIFSDLLEQLAPDVDKHEGNDLADYLIKQDWRLFRKRTKQKHPKPVPVETSIREKCEKCESLKKTFFSYVEALPRVEILKTERIERHKKEQPENWNKDIKELETYFAGITLPTEPLKLNQCSTITNISLFIESHFATIKENNGKHLFIPHLNRLQELKQVLTLKSN